jgi:hypothetical protein
VAWNWRGGWESLADHSDLGVVLVNGDVHGLC